MTRDDLSDRLREDADDLEWDGYEVQAERLREAADRLDAAETALEAGDKRDIGRTPHKQTMVVIPPPFVEAWEVLRESGGGDDDE